MDITSFCHKHQLATNNRSVTGHTECTNSRQLEPEAIGSANMQALEYARQDQANVNI